MPNWCNNDLVLSHKDSKMIDRAIAAFNEEKFFNEFVPRPIALDSDDNLWKVNPEYFMELQELKKQLNIKHYGYPSWYEWNLANWGTKWDSGGQDHIINRISENKIECSFDTAWSPPIDFYKRMAELGFEIDAQYYECGMMFCGSFYYTSEDGISDDHYTIEEATPEWVLKNIPKDIDEAFAISEQMMMDELEAEE